MLVDRRKDADFILFCDDDIVPQADHLERMIAHRKDIVSGLCVRRVDPPEPTIRRWVEETQNYQLMTNWEPGKLVECDATGTGFLLISRKVIEDVATAYHPDVYKTTGDGWWFEFLRNPGGLEWGEDISFMFKAGRLGYKIYVDTSVCPYHMGEYNYDIADYQEYEKEALRLAPPGRPWEGIERYREQGRKAALQQAERKHTEPVNLPPCGKQVETLNLMVPARGA
jgi:glycosyltransferase involved in cell wall biosynthesis